ncbi:MAG: hypothetical protein JSS65_05955 [Armatimonadetes bacterium]|nr:hypothetical protein [Armatimonadota bacterium]
MSDFDRPELDAVVASPEHHRLLMENEHVRVLETLIRPGETTALHTHQWPAATTFLSSSAVVRRDQAGNILLDTRGMEPMAAMSAAWTPQLGPHTLENVGTNNVHVVTVEIKRA